MKHLSVNNTAMQYVSLVDNWTFCFISVSDCGMFLLLLVWSQMTHLIILLRSVVVKFGNVHVLCNRITDCSVFCL